MVLGMHRSGTSAMTRVVALAGGALPVNMLTSGPHNPEGFWEPHEVMALNERILSDLDTSWNDPFGPREFRQRPIPWRPYLDEARQVIARNYSDAPLVVVKEPRATLLLELWREALEAENFRVSYVIMVRRPDEVARSLKTRDGTVLNKALILWTTYMLAAELGTRGHSRVFVNFDDLLSDPEETLDRLEAKLDLNFPRRTWETALETQEFLKADSKHHSAKRWPREIKHFPQIERFYSFLAASSRDEPWNADISDEIAAWLSQLEGVFGPILKQADRELRRVETEKRQVEDRAAESHNDLQHSLNALRAELDARASRGEAEAANLTALLDEARSAAARAQDHVGHLESVLTDLRHAHEQQQRELRERLVASEEDAAEVRARFGDLEGVLQGLRDEYKAQTATFAEQLAQASRVRAEAQSELEAKELSSAARELELSQELARAGAEAEELAAALRVAATKQVELDRRVGSLVAEGDAERLRTRELADRLADAQRDADKANSDCQDLARALAGQRARFDAHDAELQQRLAVEAAEIERVRAQNVEFARALTEVIVKRPQPASLWRRVFGRNQ